MLKRLFSSKFSIAIIILFIAVVLMLLGFKFLNQSEFGDISENTTEWNTYTNEKYGFSISYPRTWKVYEDFSGLEPKINIYKPEFKVKPPFDHFSEISNVSIFPAGIGTEGVIGRSVNSQLVFPYDTESSIDYLTKEGQVWATLITLTEVPENWKKWGFIWVKNKIIEPKFSCSRDGIEINIEECNPYDGDIFERSGSVDLKTKEIQSKILESFKILKDE